MSRSVARLLKDEILEAGAGVVGPAGSVHEALLLIDASAADGRLDAAVLDFNLGGEAVLPVADHLGRSRRAIPLRHGLRRGGCDRGLHAATPVLAKPFGPHTLILRPYEI